MSSSDNFAAAAQALAAALSATTTDPADAIRLLQSLGAYVAPGATPASPIGISMATMQAATGDLFRRAAVVALARASASYQPASANDAAAIRATVCGALDAEITVAADQHADATYNALRTLRAAVSADLTRRGAGLPSVTAISTPAPLPALVLAQRNYGDPDRADDLVTQSNCIHPAFMPLKFSALSQ